MVWVYKNKETGKYLCFGEYDVVDVELADPFEFNESIGSEDIYKRVSLVEEKKLLLKNKLKKIQS